MDESVDSVGEWLLRFLQAWDSGLAAVLAEGDIGVREGLVQYALLMAGLDMEALGDALGASPDYRNRVALGLAVVFREEPDALDSAIARARETEPAVQSELWSVDRALVVLDEAKRIRADMTS